MKMPKQLRHRKSVRLTNHDYRDGGMYFVTLCTNNKQRILGEIRNEMMGLSDVGCVVAEELQKTEKMRPYVHLDTWIIMPNHVHILFQIDDHDDCRGTARRAPTTRRFGTAIAGSLSTIVGSFKSAVTKRIREIHDVSDWNIWQRNYHEHIIRSEKECIRIRQYIRHNPATWESDPEFTKQKS